MNMKDNDMEVNNRKLIFYYNPRDKKQNKGINFSTYFNFYVECTDENDHVEYALRKDEAWISKTDIFEKDEQIKMSVSAIVGKNGAGKTTIFREIVRATYFEDISVKTRERAQYIFIFLNGDELLLFHKIETGCFQNDVLSIKEENIFDCSSWAEIKSKGKSISKPFDDISVIYFTSSYYEKWAWGLPITDKKLDNVLISPVAEGNLADIYFRKIILRNERNSYTVDEYYFWNQILARHNVSGGFQKVLDLLYYLKCYEKSSIKKQGDVGSVFISKLRDFKISFNSVDTILVAEDNSYRNYKNNNNPWDNYSEVNGSLSEEAYKELVYWNARKYVACYDGISNEERRYYFLYLNLLYEYCLEAHKVFPDEVHNSSDAKEFLSKELNAQCQINKTYYKDAMQEIADLSVIADKCEKQQDYLKADGETPDYHIRFTTETEAYVDFLTFFYKCFHAKVSFIMKYFELSQDGISSGQRYVQNLSSWLMLLPDLRHVTGNQLASLKRDNLFLVDEIGLYLHPEWQRTIISDLMKELHDTFVENNKKVQIILSTHSPIILSDIPVENTVYLYSDNTGYHVRERNEVQQTFGKEIYLLYKDAFFLDNTMGEYSTKKINNFLKKVSDTMTYYFSIGECCKEDYNRNLKPMIDEIENKLELVGNVMIEKHVRSLLKVLKGEV